MNQQSDLHFLSLQKRKVVVSRFDGGETSVFVLSWQTP